MNTTNKKTKKKTTTNNTKTTTKRNTNTNKTTTGKARRTTATTNTPGEMLLVASKTKEALKVHNVNVAADAIDGINQWVHWLIGQAANRAALNGRKTVRAHDFMAN